MTREIQHDLYPTFLADGRVLAMKGEGRHRRSHLYDLETGEKIWLFRNNTVRTVAPEYEWAPSPDGSKLLMVAERDGNTVSPERGVYLMDLTRKVTRDELLARVRRNLEAERDLRARAEAMYAPLRNEIQICGGSDLHDPDFRVSGGSLPVRVQECEPAREPGSHRVHRWETQGVRVRAGAPVVRCPGRPVGQRDRPDSGDGEPGCGLCRECPLRFQHPEPRGRRQYLGHGGASGDGSGPGRSIPCPPPSRLPSSQGRSRGFWAAGSTSGRAVESGKKLVGALNNDMVGFAEDHRLDNTIRYSNAGIRDLQHGAAILFSEMVSHDAEYYKSTDAAAYYDAYGDIVGGIGSYPILASPHYHQSHDVLETINHKLVTEVAKMSTASVMLLASTPSRLGGLGGEGRGSVEVPGPRLWRRTSGVTGWPSGRRRTLCGRWWR